MGFSEGSEEEFLLTCFVCKSPFGMTASFCGECGSNRSQALGIERANTHQKISANVPITQTMGVGAQFAPQAPVTPPAPQYDWNANPNYVNGPSIPVAPPVQNYGAQLPPRPQVKKPARQKSMKLQIARQNMSIRLNAMNTWQQNHAGTLNVSGFLMFLASVYVAIQSIIFSGVNPAEAAESTIRAAADRDPGYFQIVDDSKSYNIFPSKYSYWEATDSIQWLTHYSSNSWLGSASVVTNPNSSVMSDTPIEFKLKAKYTMTMGIFREVTWVPAENPATLTINYEGLPSRPIYINGLDAGNVGNPAVAEGTYWMYPGELTISYDRAGTNAIFSGIIQGNGNYTTTN